jgi:peptide deformylase
MWKPQPAPFSKYKKEVFERAAKVADFIYQIGEYPELRQPSKPIPLKDVTSMEVQQKIRYMHDCLRRYRRLTGFGRGLTGVQVGIPERISVLFTPDMEIMTVINPKILSKSYKQYKYPEICMSANPIIAPVVRPAWIEISYYDEEGKKKTWKTKDETLQDRIMNRVLQHELDHMEGLVNIDKVSSSSELILESDPDFYKTATFEEV